MPGRAGVDARRAARGARGLQRRDGRRAELPAVAGEARGPGQQPDDHRAEPPVRRGHHGAAPARGGRRSPRSAAGADLRRPERGGVQRRLYDQSPERSVRGVLRSGRAGGGGDRGREGPAVRGAADRVRVPGYRLRERWLQQPRRDDHLLLEQVNDQPAELVARNIVGSPTTVFFQYYRVTQRAGGVLSLDSIPAASLPLRHVVPIHLAPQDTGAAAVIDSIRAVRITLTVTNGLTGVEERRRTLTRMVNLPNVGIANKKTCGSPPILGTALGASAIVQADGTPAVQLTWNPAVDETAGEKDVVRYVLWRRVGSATDWGTPYLSIPAGSASYVYTDAAVTSGQTYQYLLAAQDCTPSLSTTSSASGVVSVP